MALQRLLWVVYTSQELLWVKNHVRRCRQERWQQALAWTRGMDKGCHRPSAHLQGKSIVITTDASVSKVVLPLEHWL